MLSPLHRNPDSICSAGEPEESLKVLMINTVPMLLEGITTVMLNYTENMNRDHLQIDFVAVNNVEPALRERIEKAGCSLFEFPGRTSRPLRHIFRLIKLIRNNHYQVVHAHGNSCTLFFEMFAACLGGVHMRCAHSHNTTTIKPWLHRLLRPAFDLSYTHGFACGQAAGRWLFRNRPFTILNNGIPADRYRFDPVARAIWREKLNVGNRIAIGHVARFTPLKNHAFLIDVFAALSKTDDRYRLVLAGDGDVRPAVEEKVRALGLEDRVIFTGSTPHIPEILSAMDLMVLPSLNEGLPNVIVEWQAAGLPALVADTVDPACRMCDLITFLPLEKECWVKGILSARIIADRSASSAQGAEAIGRAGYDIITAAARLRKLYFDSFV